MFIGHYAVGFALKRPAPRTSLGLLLASALFLDLIWPIFVLLGWEQVRIDPGNTPFTPLDFVSYPISHSLLTVVGWALVFGLVYALPTRRWAAAVWLGVGVVSHWVLDLVSHRPDLPLVPGGSMRVGLGLWNSVPATLIVEAAMFVAGVWIYQRTTRAVDRTGRLGFWILVALLAVIYVGNAFGQPPPSVRALALVALAAWIFPFWAAWIDRHRLFIPERFDRIEGGRLTRRPVAGDDTRAE